MIEFGGVFYYLDLNAFDKAISPVGLKPSDKIISKEIKTVKDNNNEIVGIEELESINDRGKEIDATKYDILRLMIETLIDYDEEIDDSLGSERALTKTPMSYKLAFNTLYNYGILKEKE